MKFIHAADIHLDRRPAKIKKLYGQQEVSVLEALQKAFISLIDYAKYENVDFIVLSGDLFDANWKDYSVGLFFIEQIKKLDCPIYYIRGNHDSENRLFKSLPFPKHLTIFKSAQAETVLNEDFKVALHGQSYSKYHIKDDLAASYPNAISGYFNIGLLHTSGEKRNGERLYAPYDQGQLLKKKYDYWALGHIHSAQILSKKPYIVYSGAIQGRHAQELGAKGCFLVEVEDHKVTSLDFKQLGNLRWEVISLNLSKVGSEDALKKQIIAQLGAIVEGEPKEVNFIVRLVVEGHTVLEKRIYENKEYYRNAIYCWISDTFSYRIYIEKIIDRALYTRRSENQKESSQIWTYITKGLEKVAREEVEKWVEAEMGALLDNIPEKILAEAQDEEVKSKTKDSFIRIIQYLESKTIRMGNENTSS